MELLSEILGATASQAAYRVRTPIRRRSRLAGRCEGVFWRPVKRQDVRQIVLAAKRYDRQTKAKGRRNGALGHVAIEVLDYLANLVDYRTGRLEPSLDTMMIKIGRSRDAIVRALKALRTHGFIDWLRRYVPVEDNGSGVQVHQTSNAYRLSLPKRALALLGRYGKASPLPDDFTHAQEMQDQEIERHRESLSLSEKALFDCGDSPIGQALARLGKAMEKRESAKRSESQSKIHLIGFSDRLSPDSG